MQSITIPLTREQLNHCRERLAESGIHLASDTPNGTLRNKGVVVDYSYDEQEEMLTVNVLLKPILVSNGMIEHKIREWFQKDQKQSS